MKLVNGAQFLNITFLLAFFGAAAVAAATVIVPLTSIYMHRYNPINLTLTLKF